jgi:hypothetical protein
VYSLPLLFSVVSEKESISLAAFRNFKEFESCSDKHIKHFIEMGLLLKQPLLFTFSIEDLKILTEHDYASILKHILDL